MARMPSQKMKTPKCLGCYVFLLDPRQPSAKDAAGKKPSYEVCLLLEKNDPFIGQMKQAIAKIATEAFGPMAVEQLKSGKIKNPLHDGDVDRPEDKNFAGKVYFNAKSTREVQVVDAKLQPVFERKECYSGCFFRASMNVAAYDYEGTKGVTCYLNAVQVVAKGPHLDSTVDATKEFEEFAEVGAPAASAVSDLF